MDHVDIALVGCGRVDAHEPRVHSIQMPCHKCGEMLWIGSQLVADLLVMGYEYDDIHALCIFTCMVIPDDTPSSITDGQREELRSRGMTDEQIDEIKELLHATIQRGDPA